jgi:hypothetical protein
LAIGARPRLLDSRHGHAQIKIVRQRLADQRLQRRILEHRSTRQVRHRLCLVRLLDEAILRRRRHFRALVVGTHGAADYRQRRACRHGEPRQR